MQMLNVNGYVGIELGRCSTPTNTPTTFTSAKSSSLRLDKEGDAVIMPASGDKLPSPGPPAPKGSGEESLPTLIQTQTDGEAKYLQLDKNSLSLR